MKKEKLSPSSLGFLQAAGVLVYCTLVSGLLWALGEYFKSPSQFVAITFFLLLFVFSAAVTGSLVFGYPAYLALNGKMKKALKILTHTLLYFLVIVTIVMLIIFLASLK